MNSVSFVFSFSKCRTMISMIKMISRIHSKIILNLINHIKDIYGDYSGGVHLFPSRTEKLSPSAQMVLQ
jgi:hypothetical protein